MAKKYCVISLYDNGTYLFDLVGITDNWCEAVGMAEITFDDILQHEENEAENDNEELQILFEKHCWFDSEDGSWRWTATTRRKDSRQRDYFSVVILEKEE